MPYLNFSIEHYPTTPNISNNLVSHVLSGRNTQTEVSSVKLRLLGNSSQLLVKNILNYAFSHNVQQLTLKRLYYRKYDDSPLSLFSSQSLKHLSLTGYVIKLTSTWELPSLTTLYPYNILVADDKVDLFSKCANLNNLTIHDCHTRASNGFNIVHPRLSHLTIKRVHCNVNVVAPQLKNLNIRGCEFGQSLKFSADSVRLMEQVDLLSNPYRNNVRKFVVLLQQLHNVKFLTLSLESVECLSSYAELIPDQPSPLSNLKSLKIYPLNLDTEPLKKVNVSIEEKKYLQDSSPSATFTLVSREDFLAVKNTTSAQNLVAELRVFLEQEKAITEIDMAHMHEQENTQPKTEMQLQIGGSMTHINSCWEDLSMQIERRRAKACLIIQKLQEIKNLLTKLPASNRAMIQPRFSSLCGEADIVVRIITDCMKIQSDEYQRRFSVCLHETVSALQLFSYTLFPSLN